MRIEALPNREIALALFSEIAARPPVFAMRHVDKPLVLYGAGNLGQMAIGLLDRIGLRPEFVLDKNPNSYRGSSFWQRFPVISPDAVAAPLKQSALLAVTIATLPFSDLHGELATQGWADIIPFYDLAEAYRHLHPLGNGWTLDQLETNDIAATQAVLSTWADDISRAHHLQFIAWHRLHEDWIFAQAPVDQSNRYFIPQVTSVLDENERFLDVGAHHGEVSARLRSLLGSQHGQIWMVEPDPANAALIAQVCPDLSTAPGTVKPVLFPLAVSDTAGEQLFLGGCGYMSQLSTLGTEQVGVTTIDQLDLTPTFMKLHLEGHELAALRGALTTIKTCRPLIASTAYHDAAGVWKLPTWLMRNLESYRFLFRLHSWCGTGAVIYAIPEERM